MQWSPTNASHPVVVILGRTNTGKSTLFNRLLSRRLAITDPTPGVTRDPIEAHCVLGGRDIILVDTGGFSLDEDDMQKLVRKKTLDQCATADLILFIIDISEMTSEDEEFCQLLNPYRDKIILVVNKMDNTKKEMLLPEKYSLGFKRTVGIAAEHGRNIRILEHEINDFLSTHTQPKHTEKTNAAVDITITLLGRPNTGKSTFLNKILGMEKSIVSDIPGTTRDVIEGRFTFRKKFFTILDTAGFRRKNKIGTSLEYYSVNRSIKSMQTSDVVILIVDALQEFSEQDKKIAGLAIKRGKGLILALNKWDLVDKVKNVQQAIKDRICFLFPEAEHIPIIPVSAKTGEGVEKVLAMVMKIRSEMRKRIETGELNRALKEWKTKYNIPLKKNTRIRYITQEGVDPIRFIVFVNSTRGFPQSYIRYLKNRIRETFGFRYTPMHLEIRSSRSKAS